MVAAEVETAKSMSGITTQCGANPRARNSYNSATSFDVSFMPLAKYNPPSRVSSRRDNSSARRGSDGFALFDLGGDLLDQGEELGEQNLFGAEADCGEDGGVERGLGFGRVNDHFIEGGASASGFRSASVSFPVVFCFCKRFVNCVAVASFTLPSMK